MKRNVIIVADYPFIDGGSHKVAIETALFLKDDFNVFYFSMGMEKGKEIDPRLINNNIKLTTYNEKSSKTSSNKLCTMFAAVYNIKAAKIFNAYLENFSPDNTLICFQTWGRISSSSVINVARKKKFKSIIMLHDYLQICPCGTLFNYKKNKICNFHPYSLNCFFCNCVEEAYIIKIGRFTRGIVQSHVLKKYKTIKYGYISKSSIRITIKNSSFISFMNSIYIPNFIPKTNTNKKTEIKVEKNEYYLFVGGVTALKGVELFCQACTDLNLKAIIIGQGNKLEELKYKFPNIKFEGWKSKADIDSYYKISRVFVAPSLCYETQGLSAIEALSAGLPVIVSDKSVTAEYIKDGYNGLHFETGSLIDLKKKLKLTQDNNLVNAMHKNALNSPIEQQTYIEYKKFIVNIYKTCF